MADLNLDTARRLMFRGSLEVLVLAVLADGPAHGYRIQKRVAEATGQPLPPGTLYPLLHDLETRALVDVSSQTVRGRPRKVYRLTEAGGHHLRSAAVGWQAAIAKMQAVVLPALRRVPRPHRPDASADEQTAADPASRLGR